MKKNQTKTTTTTTTTIIYIYIYIYIYIKASGEAQTCAPHTCAPKRGASLRKK
jgi:hypothetical protein